MQGPRAAARDRRGARRPRRDGVDVIVVARGGGSFEDLLPFSDERLVRAIAACPVPVVTRRRPRAGHAALRPRRRRARLHAERRRPARRARPGRAARAARTAPAPASSAAPAASPRPRAPAPRPGARAARPGSAPVLERGARGSSTRRASRALSPRSTLERGYAIVRASESIVRSGRVVQPGDRVEVELADGGFGARVEDVR